MPQVLLGFIVTVVIVCTCHAIPHSMVGQDSNKQPQRIARGIQVIHCHRDAVLGTCQEGSLPCPGGYSGDYCLVGVCCLPYSGCTNTCEDAFDGDWNQDFDCDDGGPGSVAQTCAFGTDCQDCGPRVDASVKLDPHVMTFDGLKFNFNGYCSYTLVKSCDDAIYPPFEITADFRGRDPNAPYEPPTFMQAFNITSNGKQVIRINEDNTVLVEGKLITSPSTVIGANGQVSIKNNTILIHLNEPAVSLTWKRLIHGIEIGLNDMELRGKVCGLLGNSDGNPKNDFIKRDGQRTFSSVEFGDSWLIPGSCP